MCTQASYWGGCCIRSFDGLFHLQRHMIVYVRSGDGPTGLGASFHGVGGLSLFPIIAAVIALFVIVVISAVVLVVCRRRSTSSKAAAAAAGGGLASTSPGTAASSALLAGQQQRISCGSSAMATTTPLSLHHQYAELRDHRPSTGVVTHCTRLGRPSPPPPPPQQHHQPTTAANPGSPFSSYSSMSKTGGAPALTGTSQVPHHLPYDHNHQLQAYQMHQQMPHLQYYERCWTPVAPRRFMMTLHLSVTHFASRNNYQLCSVNCI